jgi:predicted RNase H-like HicB family nuclease
MSYYVGILDGSGTAWGVRIPDCPGAYGAGAGAEEAIASAVAGLAAWAQAVRKDGESLPAARSLAEMARHPEDGPRVEAGEVAVLIPLLLESGRTVRANLTLDAGLLAAIDEAAALRGQSRSAFMACAAREKIGGR